MWFLRDTTTRLGRWCLRASPRYNRTCNEMVKGHLADCDNGWSPRPPPRPDHRDPPKRDPISVLAADM